MKKRILAICDLETEYAVRFAEFLDKKLLPFDVRIFTQAQQLIKFCRETKVEIILISESAYSQELAGLEDVHILILNESGNRTILEYTNVDKYQSSENILREVMCYYTSRDDSAAPQTESAVRSRLIGVYSPVKRCLQTSFAMTMGQIMAKKNKVLYMNLEGYSGFGRLMHKDFNMELSDLLYYVKHAKGKLLYRLESMVEEVGGLYYVPPIFSIQDMAVVSSKDWQELIEQLCRISGYEYIILDLSDNMQGLFEILRKCGRIYTIVGKDGIAQAKIEQYEQLLRRSDYEDVLEKTRKCTFPQFYHMPAAIEQLPFSEFADYIRKRMRTWEYESAY